GIDLVPIFDTVPTNLEFLTLRQSSVMNMKPEKSFDLITCVHGLHYIGDKLGLVERVCSWLKSDGLFVANLDLDNLKTESFTNPKTRLRKAFRNAGLEYDSRKHLLSCRGQRQ